MQPPPLSPPSAVRATRNRDETEARILDAALDVLTTEGFGAFGVNAVARRAGCDKKLIYRYFDGLDGLSSAMGAHVAATLADALEKALEPAPDTYADLIERLAMALFRHLHGNAAWRQLKVMELTAPSPATAAFQSARGKVLADWMARARHGLTAPPGRDAAALNAVLIAAVEGLAVLGPAGLDPDDPATVGRLEASVRALTQRAYGA